MFGGARYAVISNIALNSSFLSIVGSLWISVGKESIQCMDPTRYELHPRYNVHDKYYNNVGQERGSYE